MENKVDENSGTYDFSHDPLNKSEFKMSASQAASEIDAVIMDSIDSLIMRDSPGKAKNIIVTGDQITNARIKAMGDLFGVQHPALKAQWDDAVKMQAETLEDFFRDEVTDRAIYMDIDIEKIRKQVLECGMKHEDILAQLMGWHTLALAKGTRDEKIAAMQLFTSLEYITGEHKIKVL